MGSGMSEFFEGVKDFFTNDMVSSLQVACIKMYTSIFSQANNATESAALQVMVTPENMFPEVYKIVEYIAQTVFFPIAAIILVYVICQECVTLMTESNRMRDFGPQDVFVLCMKLLLGVYLLTNSIEIVNTCFKVGQWAVRETGLESANIDLEAGLDASSYINECKNILDLLGYLLLGTLVKIGVFIFSIVIKIAVWIRFVELYMFAVSSPIPFATLLNKEWSQIGYNYVRKIMALAFQPVYMILCFTIFTGTLILQSESGIVGSLAKSFAAMFILGIALFKTGSIASSIFNAH